MAGSKSDILAALGWLTDAGADEAVCDAPVDHFAVPDAKDAGAKKRPEPAVRPTARDEPAALGQGARQTISARTDAPPIQPPTPTNSYGRPTARADTDSIGQAVETAAACNSLIELRSALEAFDGCSLKKTATKTVFADGTPRNGIMLIGEAPGREEDIAGLPFVGRAGKLLDKMLAAIGLSRNSNVYITNVLNWRPPGNRDPSPDEAASCLPFLRRHVELVSPSVIVLLGAVATRHALGRSDGIMRLRGKWQEYYVNGRMVPVMPTLHPAYLLRRAIDKRLAWHDLQEISAKVNSLGLLEVRSLRG
jgi:uracil-DNA glycosylase